MTLQRDNFSVYFPIMSREICRSKSIKRVGAVLEVLEIDHDKNSPGNQLEKVSESCLYVKIMYEP